MIQKIKDYATFIWIIITGIILFILYQDKRQLDQMRIRLRKKETDKIDEDIQSQEEKVKRKKEEYAKKRADYLNKLDQYNAITGPGRNVRKDSKDV